MSEEDATAEKTLREHLQDVISRLKDFEHQSRTNIEHLSEDWLLLDETLKQKDEAKRVEELLTTQSKAQDLVTAMIKDFQIRVNQLEMSGE